VKYRWQRISGARHDSSGNYGCRVRDGLRLVGPNDRAAPPCRHRVGRRRGYSRLMGRDESGKSGAAARPALPMWPSYTALANARRARFTRRLCQRRDNRMSVNRLPPVGRIRALHLPEGGPRVPRSLVIEYSDRSNASKWYQVEVPFVDAMHLLALLQGAKDEVGYKEPVEAPPPEKD
jgi:hypothetical protein